MISFQVVFFFLEGGGVFSGMFWGCIYLGGGGGEGGRKGLIVIFSFFFLGFTLHDLI